MIIFVVRANIKLGMREQNNLKCLPNDSLLIIKETKRGELYVNVQEPLQRNSVGKKIMNYTGETYRKLTSTVRE